MDKFNAELVRKISDVQEENIDCVMRLIQAGILNEAKLGHYEYESKNKEIFDYMYEHKGYYEENGFRVECVPVGPEKNYRVYVRW